MKRRSLIAGLGLGMIGLIAKPEWAYAWSSEKVKFTTLVSGNIELQLAEIAELILPETKSPGAKTLEIHKFILKYINDIIGKGELNKMAESIESLNKNLTQISGKPLQELNLKEKEDLISKITGKTEIEYTLNFIKTLAILAYTTSEYYLFNHTDYNMAPGFYNGCVKIKN